ncbi:hypothetical protein ACIGGE_12090 [Qipengyuania sp. NPDC077410]|uniref:hypothetical protein n=1 Tax=Qipengyuania sp. NPDC077410 TaxID=3364496 RepID=UPI0037C828B5
MHNFIDATERAIDDQIWIAGLTTALSMPDICASLASENGKTNGQKYANWWDKYVGSAYRSQIGAKKIEHVFMSGDDCYALRCAYLHNGSEDLSKQKVNQTLNRFIFVEPPTNGSFFHLNQFDSQLQVQVDVFCRDIVAGVSEWLEDVAGDDRIQQEMAKLSVIRTSKDVFGI